MSYRKEVEFLEDCSPALVERNADEYRRLRDLLMNVDSPAGRAENRTHWRSEGSKQYVQRVGEARRLLAGLAEGYDKAAGALRAYAGALEAAKGHYSDGKAAERSLAALIGTKGTAVTRAAQEAEPMRQWEDMRATTGVLDFFAELTMDVDDIRDEANRLHDAAGGSFHLAKVCEKEARDVCVHALKQAYDLLPEYRVRADERVDLQAAIAALRHEAAEAQGNPLTRLPGSGPKEDLTAPVGDRLVSPALQDIRTRLASLPTAEDSYWIPPQTDEGRSDWIAANKEIIKAAARDSGLPEDMVAGIAWQEVGGTPGFVDDTIDTIREQANAPWGLSPIAPQNLPYRAGGAPDETSFGPIAIQVRRGAEVLGYDPGNLTEQQRNIVEQSLQDPGQNIFIAAGYLAQLKAESEFADIPPDRMTQEQYQELAARYNGGPYWENQKAQNYGDRLVDDLGRARDALR
jgi:soluble lytic murein transglycosylase-like protein